MTTYAYAANRRFWDSLCAEQKRGEAGHHRLLAILVLGPYRAVLARPAGVCRRTRREYPQGAGAVLLTVDTLGGSLIAPVVAPG